MKIFVKAKPNSKEEKVEKIGEKVFLVRVKEAPIEGKANIAIVKALADYFGKPKTSIQILKGGTFKEKIVEIN